MVKSYYTDVRIVMQSAHLGSDLANASVVKTCTTDP